MKVKNSSGAVIVDRISVSLAIAESATLSESEPSSRPSSCVSGATGPGARASRPMLSAASESSGDGASESPERGSLIVSKGGRCLAGYIDGRVDVAACLY